MSRKINKAYSNFKRDCNLVSLFWFEFKEKPTKKQVHEFVKKFQQSEKVEAKERMKLIKNACKRCS